MSQDGELATPGSLHEPVAREVRARAPESVRRGGAPHGDGGFRRKFCVTFGGTFWSRLGVLIVRRQGPAPGHVVFGNSQKQEVDGMGYI